MNCLIYKIPDKAAAHIIVFFKIIHIFLEVAEGVFHRMGVFAKQDRLALIHLSPYRLAVCGKLVRYIIIKRNLYLLFIAQLFHNIGSWVHSGDDIAFC